MGQKLIWLFAAGGVGTLARYALQGFVQQHYGSGFPWGTLAVNLLGCFLFGMVWSLAEERLLLSGEIRLVILVGLMGGFTTFSSYMFETRQMFRDAQWLWASAYVVGSNGLGFLSLMLGVALGRKF